MQAVGDANGPLLQHLAKEIGHHDKWCVDLLRRGCPLVGRLPCSGNGQPNATEATGETEVAALVAAREETNGSLLKSLREDPRSADLLKMAAADAAMGRMSKPRHLRDSDISRFSLSPRFCIEQG